MMNDWRDHPYTYESNSLSVKLAAMALVAIGFVSIGSYAYLKGGPHLQSAQAIGSNATAPQSATTNALATPDSLPDATPPEASPATAEPPTNAVTDTPPVAAPAQSQPAEKPVKVTRAQHQQETPSVRETESEPFSASVPDPQPEVAAPTASNHNDAAPEESNNPVTTDVPQQLSPPPTDSGETGTGAAPQ